MSSSGASLSVSSLREALRFKVPGSKATELEKWLQRWRPAEAERVRGATDRYAFVQLVEKAQREMREQLGEGDDDSDASDESHTPRKGTKRKSRTSLGYEGGKPSPASPRVKKPAATRSTRRSKAPAEVEEEEAEEDSHAAEEEAEEAAPKKKARTSTAAAAAAAPATRKSKAGATSAAGKRKSTRASRRVKAEDEEAEDAEMESRATDETSEMADEREAELRAAVKARPSFAPSGTQSKRASLAPTAGGFVDSSLFGSSSAYVDPSLLAPSQPAAVDEDVEMRAASSPSPSPSEKFDVSVAPTPVVPNPFQRSPGAPHVEMKPILSPPPAAASTSSSFTSSTAAAPRLSMPSSVLQPTPFTMAGLAPTRKTQSLAPAATRFQPLQPTPGLFSPSPPASRVSSLGLPTAKAPEAREEDFRAFDVPHYVPSVSRRASSGGIGAVSPAEETLRRRFSMSSRTVTAEEKYPAVSARKREPAVEVEDEEEAESVGEEAEEKAALAPSTVKAAHRRRFSDKSTALSDEAEAAEAAKTAPAPLPVRARLFCASLLRFLLRTLLIGLMIGTLALVWHDGRLWTALAGRRESPTVFCSSPDEPPLPLDIPLPKGQLRCLDCPPHGHCKDGRLHCVAPYDVREGDQCVLGDAAHRSAHRIKEAAIDVLERRLGDVECGYLPAGAQVLNEEQLISLTRDATASDSEVPSDSFGELWPEAMRMLELETASKPGPGVRVIQPSRHIDLYRALTPSLTLRCQMGQLVARNWIELSLASLLLSLLSYAWFLLRRWRVRRSAVHAVSSALLQRLQHNYDYDYGSHACVFLPFAVAHLKEEFVRDSRAADLVVWSRVVDALNRDSRVEKGRVKFGNTERDAWTWTGPPPKEALRQ